MEEDAVFVTTRSALPNDMHAENSEVLPCGSVAVAVTASPKAGTVATMTFIAATPPAPVVTFAEPRKVRPSPCPAGSQLVLEKNSIVKVVEGTLVSDPSTLIPPGALDARVSTGKF
jgi:hypothetical protein